MSIRRDTLANLVGAILPMFVLIITVPLYLKILGDMRYGVLALVWLVLGYFSFLDMGLGRATSNHIARLKDAKDRDRGEIFWSAITVNSAFGLLAALILWSIGSYLLTNVLKIPVELRDEAVDALPWMIATLPLALITSVLNGALEGRGKFIVVNGLQVSGTIFFQLVPLLVAYRYSPSLSYVIPAAVLTRAFMNIPVFVACIYCVRLSSLPGVSISAMKSLLAYGGWVAVSGIIGPIIETVDRLLIGIMLGPQAVTYYTVPYQLVTKARVIPGSLSRVLFPRFSADSSIGADKLAFRSLLVLLVVMTPVVVCGILLLKPLMTIWIGKDLAVITAPIGAIIFVGVWFNSLAQIPCFLMMGKGRPDIITKLHLLEIVPFLLILWFVMKYWGVYGAAWAWSIRALVDNLLLIKLSGIAKGYLRIMVYPTAMITGAIIAANFVSGELLVWRLGLVLLFVIWIWVWVKRKYNAIISSVYVF